MPCYYPIRGWRAKRRNPNGKRSIVFRKGEGYGDMPIDVPCGQCIGCRLEHSRKWAVRCMHEAQMHEDNSFITLTYCDEKIPEYSNLQKSHFQKFMMRIRKKYGKGIKYYACGEYGEQTLRPHYHACLFGLDFKDKTLWKESNEHPLYVSEELNKLWTDPKDNQPYGWASIGTVTFESAAYVARYCMKKRKGKDKDVYYEFHDPVTGEVICLQPEFALMSRKPGIGKAWLEKFQTDVYPSDSIIVNYKETKPPRYYDNLYEKDAPRTMAIVKAQRKHQAKIKSEDNTLARLHVKCKVKQSQINNLNRSIENAD